MERVPASHIPGMPSLQSGTPSISPRSPRAESLLSPRGCVASQPTESLLSPRQRVSPIIGIHSSPLATAHVSRGHTEAYNPTEAHNHKLKGILFGQGPTDHPSTSTDPQVGSDSHSAISFGGGLSRTATNSTAPGSVHLITSAPPVANFLLRNPLGPSLTRIDSSMSLGSDWSPAVVLDDAQVRKQQSPPPLPPQLPDPVAFETPQLLPAGQFLKDKTQDMVSWAHSEGSTTVRSEMCSARTELETARSLWSSLKSPRSESEAAVTSASVPITARGYQPSPRRQPTTVPWTSAYMTPFESIAEEDITQVEAESWARKSLSSTPSIPTISQPSVSGDIPFRVPPLTSAYSMHIPALDTLSVHKASTVPVRIPHSVLQPAVVALATESALYNRECPDERSRGEGGYVDRVSITKTLVEAPAANTIRLNDGVGEVAETVRLSKGYFPESRRIDSQPATAPLNVRILPHRKIADVSLESLTRMPPFASMLSPRIAIPHPSPKPTEPAPQQAGESNVSIKDPMRGGYGGFSRFGGMSSLSTSASHPWIKVMASPITTSTPEGNKRESRDILHNKSPRESRVTHSLSLMRPRGRDAHARKAPRAKLATLKSPDPEAPDQVQLELESLRTVVMSRSSSATIGWKPVGSNAPRRHSAAAGSGGKKHHQSTWTRLNALLCCDVGHKGASCC